mgnify:CR=1 FL=1
MFEPAERLKNVKVSASSAMTRKVRELRAQGVKIVGLSSGEPDFMSPRHAIEAGYKAALAGDYKKAIEICATLTPLRQIHAKWVGGYGKPHGRMPSAEMKYWMECIGMPGGPVRSPCVELPEDKKAEMYAELKATGILDRVKTAKKAA